MNKLKKFLIEYKIPIISIVINLTTTISILIYFQFTFTKKIDIQKIEEDVLLSITQDYISTSKLESEISQIINRDLNQNIFKTTEIQEVSSSVQNDTDNKEENHRINLTTSTINFTDDDKKILIDYMISDIAYRKNRILENDQRLKTLYDQKANTKEYPIKSELQSLIIDFESIKRSEELDLYFMESNLMNFYNIMGVSNK